jgi:uncharacterized membrane protein YeaQ/YmgE (transglycosylase-associated protein family)
LARFVHRGIPASIIGGSANGVPGAGSQGTNRVAAGGIGAMDFLWWIIIGAVAGGVASLVVPGRTPGGIIGAVVVGLVGGWLGGWLMSLFGMVGPTSFLGSVVVGALGGIVILFILRAMSGRSTTV